MIQLRRVYQTMRCKWIEIITLRKPFCVTFYGELLESSFRLALLRNSYVSNECSAGMWKSDNLKLYKETLKLTPDGPIFYQYKVFIYVRYIVITYFTSVSHILKKDNHIFNQYTFYLKARQSRALLKSMVILTMDYDIFYQYVF